MTDNIVDFSSFMKSGSKKLPPDLIAIMLRVKTAKRTAESIYELNDLDWASFLLLHATLHAHRTGMSKKDFLEVVAAVWDRVEAEKVLGVYL